MQKATEKSALIQSGIATSDPNIVLNRGGTVINLPFWKNLSGDDEVLSDSVGLTSAKLIADKDIACIHLRGKSWCANDLASLIAGDNAVNAIGDQIASYWARAKQQVLVASLEGAFKASSMSGSVLDISGGEGAKAILSTEAMLDGMYLLGDNYDTLTGVMMHSAVMNKLAKLDLIDYLPDSEGRSSIPTYMGKRVIVDDMLKPADSAYPIYFFGAGAVAYNEGKNIENIETDRDRATGDDYIFTRYQFTMHPRGIKWIGSPAGVSPNNEELATGTNWELVEDKKNVAITKLIARLA